MSFDFGGSLELDANDYIASAEEAADASQEFADGTEVVAESGGALENVDWGGVVAGIGTAGVGGALSEATESSSEWRESLGRVAEDVEEPRDEIVDLAGDLEDATFPMDDVVGALDEMGSQGIDTADDMEDIALAADNVADATDSSAEDIVDGAGPALRALGGDLTDLEDEMDTFTFLAREADAPIAELGQTMNRQSDAFSDAGVEMDEMAPLIAALQDEGVEGTAAVRELASAAEDTEGDIADMADEVGVSEDALDDQIAALDDADGMTDSYADAANDAITPMDRMSSVSDTLRLRFGNLLQPIQAAGPALMGVGGAMSAASAIGLGSVVPSLAAVGTGMSMLLGPIGLVIGAVGLLAAAFLTDFGGIRTFTEEFVGDLIELFGEFTEWFTEHVSEFLDWLDEIWSETLLPLVEFVGEQITRLQEEILAPFFEWFRETVSEFLSWLGEIYEEHFEELVEEFIETFSFLEEEVLAPFFAWFEETVGAFLTWLSESIEDGLAFLSELWDDHGERVMEIVDLLFGTIERIVEDAIEILTESISAFLSLIRGDWEGFRDNIANITDVLVDIVADLFGWMRDTVEEILTNTFEIGEDAFRGFVEWVSGVWDLPGVFADVFSDAVGRALGAVTDLVSDAADRLKEFATDLVPDWANRAIDSFRDIFNSVVPSSLSIPSVTISNPLPGASDFSVGGGSIDLPQLDVGAHIQGDGLAMLHEGEDVLPKADVDKGNPRTTSGRSASATGRGDDVVNKLDEMTRLLKDEVAILRDLDRGDVKQKDVLRALDISRDRLGGRGGR